MPRSLALLLTLATLSAAAQAQSTDAAGPENSSYTTQSQPAPIVRAYADHDGSPYPGPSPQSSQPAPPARSIASSQPILGVWLRVAPDATTETVSADPKSTEIRVVHGVANISVHQPEHNARILVDLPGGQVSLLKDGLYTFNAETNTVRVLKGEAEAFPGSIVKGVKVKETQQFAFAVAATRNRSIDVPAEELMSDYLPGNPGPIREGYPTYAYSPYADGFYGYGYPYYGYPYAYGYPYGYGLGLGFGYYGGFGGGFRGGYRGGRR